MLDARWAHHAGATAFTRLVLRGLAEVAPGGRWLLWGPADMVDHTWPGAVHVPTSTDPVAWFGQRSALRVPHADRVFHPHQTRPMHRLPAATCVLDLIQLQHPSRPVRMAKTARLRAAVRAARFVFTITGGVRDELVADFGVDRDSVTVLHLPVDRDSAARVVDRRRTVSPTRSLLCIARFDRHKNLPRLVRAFGATEFAARGGTLTLVGGTEEELVSLGLDRIPSNVQVTGKLDQPQLEQLLAAATAVVQASLAEGYGLPVAEALLAEVPVVSSPVPAVTEFGPAGVPTFDPRSEDAIRDAIDETVALIDAGTYWKVVDRGPWAAALPTTRDLAQQVLLGLDRVSSSSGTPSHQ